MGEAARPPTNEDMDIPRFHIAPPAGWHLASVPFNTPDLPSADGVAGSFLFLVRDGLDVETALEAALNEAAVDDLLAAQAAEEGYGFNLADLIDRWPDADWVRHGLMPVSLPLTDQTAVIDHDEVLVTAA